MLLIDTNVYSALDKGDAMAIDILHDQSNIYIPIMVIGELRYGFMNGSKQQENNVKLSKFLAQDVVEVVFPSFRTADIYAQLCLHCKQTGRALSHNDLWIAALAQENGLQLATYDRDFTALTGILGDKLVVLTD